MSSAADKGQRGSVATRPEWLVSKVQGTGFESTGGRKRAPNSVLSMSHDIHDLAGIDLAVEGPRDPGHVECPLESFAMLRVPLPP
jgi:hypothetical protein